MGRRTLLTAGASALAFPETAFPASTQDPRSLKAIAAAKGFVFGSAAASYELKDADFPPVLLRETAQLVPEYEMKRGALETKPGSYDFAALDSLFAFAAKNRLSMRGHPVCWYYANPPWLVSLLADRRNEKLLTNHIQAVLRRYPMDSVDVVN